MWGCVCLEWAPRVDTFPIHLRPRRTVHARLAAVPDRDLSVDTLRALPSVHQLLEEEPAAPLIAEHGRLLVRFAVQRILEDERRGGALARPKSRWAGVGRGVQELRPPGPRTGARATR